MNTSKKKDCPYGVKNCLDCQKIPPLHSITSPTPPKEFDFEQAARDYSSDSIDMAKPLYLAFLAGYKKAQSQFEAEREKLWEAAREGASGQDDFHLAKIDFSYKNLAAYDAALRGDTK